MFGGPLTNGVRVDQHGLVQRIAAAEVVIDRRDIDVRLAGDLAQRSAAESVLGEQGFGGVENPFLGRKLGFAHGGLRCVT